MISWNQTPDGWAVNLDGSNAASQFSLPRLELHSGRQGWTCVCRFADGTSRPVPLGRASSAADAKRAGAEEALLVLGAGYDAQLRALLL